MTDKDFDRNYRWPLLRMLNRRAARKPVYTPPPETLRAFLRVTPHPFAFDGTSLRRCICGLDALHEAHDNVSLLDTRAFLNGTGGTRERLARELAARMPEGEDGDG